MEDFNSFKTNYENFNLEQFPSYIENIEKKDMLLSTDFCIKDKHKNNLIKTSYFKLVDVQLDNIKMELWKGQH